MSRLDDIQKRLDERMAEIDRRIMGKTGSDKRSSDGEPGTDHVGTRGVAMGDWPFEIAPLNPEYVEWARGDRRSTDNSLGLMPHPFDAEYLRRYSSDGQGARVAKSFPAKYDLRTEGVLPPVRNQGANGTCWAHAAIASVESCLRKKTGEGVDLSENNMANLHGFTAYFDKGADHHVASAYLLRWDGPVLEKDDPYGHPGASRSFPAVKHVQTIRWVPQMSSANDTAGIKEAVSTMGGVWAAYLVDRAPSAYNEQTAAYYMAEPFSGNGGGHAVAIVGWDDNFPASKFKTPPPGDGAWIVRNSWGTGWGDLGYFYVSYYDPTFARIRPQVVYCGVEPKNNYDDVLQYDYLGAVTQIGNSENATAANVFTTARDTVVEAVGFYALVPGTRYRISIRVGCGETNPGVGSEQGVTSGVCEWAGYDTIKLSVPVHVSAGMRFAVVVEMTTPGLTRPIAVETDMPERWAAKADAAEGQSFALDNGRWIDLTHKVRSGEQGKDRNINFCCKAYVKYVGNVQRSLEDGGEERSHKRFCKKCGKYTWTESWTGGRCQYCDAWLSDAGEEHGEHHHSDGEERSYKRFCKKCGKYTWTEHSTGGRCQYCDAFLGEGEGEPGEHRHDGEERASKRFCKKCGKYTWTEYWNEAARCPHCGAWL